MEISISSIYLGGMKMYRCMYAALMVFALAVGCGKAKSDEAVPAPEKWTPPVETVMVPTVCMTTDTFNTVVANMGLYPVWKGDMYGSKAVLWLSRAGNRWGFSTHDTNGQVVCVPGMGEKQAFVG